MKKKNFDCVKMKADIQKKIMDETKGMSVDERLEYSEKRISRDPLLGKFWKKAKKIPQQPRAVTKAK